MRFSTYWHYRVFLSKPGFYSLPSLCSLFFALCFSYRATTDQAEIYLLPSIYCNAVPLACIISVLLLPRLYQLMPFIVYYDIRKNKHPSLPCCFIIIRELFFNICVCANIRTGINWLLGPDIIPILSSYKCFLNLADCLNRLSRMVNSYIKETYNPRHIVVILACLPVDNL